MGKLISSNVGEARHGAKLFEKRNGWGSLTISYCIAMCGTGKDGTLARTIGNGVGNANNSAYGTV